MPRSAPAAPAARPSAPTAGPFAGLTTAVIVLLAIVALYFGRDILVPFALAMLLSFLLGPPLSWLRRLRVPRIAAVVVVVGVAIALIGGLAALVGSQLMQLAENLPSYQWTMQQKIAALRESAPGGGVIDRLIALFQSLGDELARPPGEAAGAKPAEPVPVQIAPSGQPPLEVIQRILGPLVGPAVMAGLVVVFTVFFLLERDDLRDRFIRLAGQDVHRTTGAIGEAAERVSRYLLMQLVINASYGIPVGIGLYFIGVPNAFLWGLLATLLRFVPYLGPFIAALFPLTLAFVVDPGWNMLLWTAALLIAMELISNNIMEPWLYGSSTGLSPVAVIFAAIFWTTLWGPIGLILATPLTVCLVVMGRYIPQFGFLGVLLGSDPVLAPEERLYQRLLGGHTEEAIDIAEEELDEAEGGAPAFYDAVGLPALRLAADDRRRGAADLPDVKRIAEGAQAVVRELRDEPAEVPEPANEEEALARRLAGPVLCIAGRDELDAAAGAMLAHTLEARGIDSRELPASSIAPAGAEQLDLAGAGIACLSYLRPAPRPYARYACRRLRRHAPRLKIVLGLWNLGPGDTAERIAEAAGADAAATTIAEAVAQVERLAGRPAVPAPVPPPVPEGEGARLAALHASAILEPGRRAHLDAVARKVSAAFGTPIGLVSLVDEECQVWVGAEGLPEALEADRKSPRETSICGHVIAADEPLVIEDVAADPRFAGNPFLRAHGIRFYAGAPLRTADGHAIGSLCVVDMRPRSLGPRDMKLLQVIADELMAEVEHAAVAPAAPAGSRATG